jgi:hypothetical protein
VGALPPDDILALIFGILFTLRKLDIAKREVASYGHLTREDFERWKGYEKSAYSLGSTACFFKIAVDFGLRFSIGKFDPYLWRGIAAVAFIGWIAALVASGIISWRARKMRVRLGIALVAAPPPEEDPKAPD